MSLHSKRVVILICLIAIIGRPMLLFAQGGGDEISDYLRPGESIVTLKRGLSYNGHLYRIHYITAGGYRSESFGFIAAASAESFKKNKIMAVFVTEDGNLVKDEALMRKILVLYRASCILYENTHQDGLGNITKGFVKDFQAITHNPIFLKQRFNALFSTREEETAEAFRGILTAQLETPNDIEAFGQGIRQLVKNGKTISDAIDLTLDAARFSNSKVVREEADDIRDVFKSWEPITDQGYSFVKLGGQRLDLFNALDVLSLSVRLIWLMDLQEERSKWVHEYVGFATREGSLDNDQLFAFTVVEQETYESSTQRADIVLDFVKEQAVHLITHLTTKELVKMWVDWSWKTFGKRTTGHLVAGAASAVALGYTLGDLLYGLDDLYDNFRVGERTDELRSRFRATRLSLEDQASAQPNGPYDGRLASEYRIAYMLESLATAQVYRLYADGVNATIRQGLFELINPLAWLRGLFGEDWKEVVRGLNSTADDIEKETEDDIGHPAFVDAAIQLTLERMRFGGNAIMEIVVDDSAEGFHTSGNPDYWWTMSGGYDGSAVWTYGAAQKHENIAHWSPSVLSAGFYTVQVYIPPFSKQINKNYTRSAQYTIKHADQSEKRKVDQQNGAGSWVTLGDFFFDGNGQEFVELIDTTGEPSGSTTVVFDAIRWQRKDQTGLIWDARPSGGVVYDIITSTEMSHLKIAMKNTGQGIWSGSAFSLKAINTSTTPLSYPLQGAVAPGQVATWQYEAFSAGSPGIHQVRFQMYRGNVPFGEILTSYIVILPESLKDREQQIREQIDRWQQQGGQRAEEFMDQLWKSLQEELARQAKSYMHRLLQSIQKEIQRKTKDFLEKIRNQCFGPIAMAGMALAFVYHKQRR